MKKKNKGDQSINHMCVWFIVSTSVKQSRRFPCYIPGGRKSAVLVNPTQQAVLSIRFQMRWEEYYALQRRHNERDGVSNHQPHDCLLNRLFRRRSKKTPKPRVTGLCEGKSPVNSPHKWAVARKMFPFDDVIMVNFFEESAPCTVFPVNTHCNRTITVSILARYGILPALIICLLCGHISTYVPRVNLTIKRWDIGCVVRHVTHFIYD